MSIEIIREWDNSDVWVRFAGSPADIATFQAETGADKALFNNSGCATAVPGLEEAMAAQGGALAFLKGWWFQYGTPDMGGCLSISAYKGIPTQIHRYIEAAYDSGINPLPQLRQTYPTVKWEYVSNTYRINRQDGTVTLSGEPFAIVARQDDLTAILFWDGKQVYTCGDTDILPTIAAL